MAVGGAPHSRMGAAGLHDVIVYVTTNMAFMNDKEVEYLIIICTSEKDPFGTVMTNVIMTLINVCSVWIELE